MAALRDAGFPGRASFVQAGVDPLATHLPPVDPAAPATVLVVFPEDVGLVAALIGSRGAAARAQTSAVGAIAALFGPYAAQYDYYTAKYLGQPPVRPLVLAVTDTLYRGFYETFRELAMTHGVYLAASFNAAPARRVEQATEPDLVALLRDPDEPSRTYAYEAVSPFPYNTTLVFAPDGEVLVPDGNGGTLESPSATGGVIRGSGASGRRARDRSDRATPGSGKIRIRGSASWRRGSSPIPASRTRRSRSPSGAPCSPRTAPSCSPARVRRAAGRWRWVRARTATARRSCSPTSTCRRAPPPRPSIRPSPRRRASRLPCAC